MNVIEDILQSDKKHKEKINLIVNEVLNNEKLIVQLVELLKLGSDVEKGTSAEIMKFVSKEKPELLISFIETLIEFIDHKANRVKWGIPETIGNLAREYPEEVEIAIPKLWINTTHKSTVVRWCAAYALTEIGKNNARKRAELVPRFTAIIETEQNNGVKNVYLKALKSFD